MKKINLTITGCLGRMGQQLVRSSKNSKNFKLVSLTENRMVNQKISGLRPQLNSISAFKNANIIININPLIVFFKYTIDLYLVSCIAAIFLIFLMRSIYFVKKK